MVTNIIIQRIKKLSLEVIILLLVFVACCWGLLAIADMVFEDNSHVFDDAVFSAIQPYINNSNAAFFSFITFFGSSYFLLPANILLVGIFLFHQKNRKHSLLIAAVSITSTSVLFLLKYTLQRQRPLVPLISKAHGYSFPSGHTFSSFVFFGMLVYIVYKTVSNPVVKWGIILFLACFTFLIGFSRVYLKLHYASDVIAGFLLGMIWLLVSRWVLVKYDDRV